MPRRSASGRTVWKLAEIFRLKARSSGLKAGATSSIAESTIEAQTTAEIIFTSGATAEPKGVVLTHKNILANIVPIEHEMAKYQKYTRPFRPIRFLNLLPLSHMFGQAMATFVPPMLPGVVVFTRSYAPDDIVRQIKERRISVLVCVPKILEVLRDYVMRVAPEAAEPPPPGCTGRSAGGTTAASTGCSASSSGRWSSGAAPLDPELEAFWGRLGFLVVQGYGLTETAPIVTLNHPLRARRGAVGKPISGVEIKIADDGEILVRGENVTTGYYNAPEATREAFADGWFHTGDIGELDAEGRLMIRGRKKEMIVTPEGLNVFPEDVERALQRAARRGRCRGRRRAGAGQTAERVQAILLLADGRGSRSRRPQRERAAGRPPEDPRVGDLAGQGAAAHRRHAETEAPRAAELAVRAAVLDLQADSAGRRTSRDVAGVLARFAPGRTIDVSDDDRRAGAVVARARRADDGARGDVPGDGGRKRRSARPRPLRISSNSSRPPDWGQPPATLRGFGEPEVEPRSDGRADAETRLPLRGTDRCRRGPRGASACRRGSCRSAGSSRA